MQFEQKGGSRSVDAENTCILTSQVQGCRQGGFVKCSCPFQRLPFAVGSVEYQRQTLKVEDSLGLEPSKNEYLQCGRVTQVSKKSRLPALLLLASDGLVRVCVCVSILCAGSLLKVRAHEEVEEKGEERLFVRNDKRDSVGLSVRKSCRSVPGKGTMAMNDTYEHIHSVDVQSDFGASSLHASL